MHFTSHNSAVAVLLALCTGIIAAFMSAGRELASEW